MSQEQRSPSQSNDFSSSISNEQILQPGDEIAENLAKLEETIKAYESREGLKGYESEAMCKEFKQACEDLRVFFEKTANDLKKFDCLRNELKKAIGRDTNRKEYKEFEKKFEETMKNTVKWKAEFVKTLLDSKTWIVYLKERSTSLNTKIEDLKEICQSGEHSKQKINDITKEMLESFVEWVTEAKEELTNIDTDWNGLAQRSEKLGDEWKEIADESDQRKKSDPKASCKAISQILKEHSKRSNFGRIGNCLLVCVGTATVLGSAPGIPVVIAASVSKVVIAAGASKVALGATAAAAAGVSKLALATGVSQLALAAGASKVALGATVAAAGVSKIALGATAAAAAGVSKIALAAGVSKVFVGVGGGAAAGVGFVRQVFLENGGDLHNFAKKQSEIWKAEKGEDGEFHIFPDNRNNESTLEGSTKSMNKDLEELKKPRILNCLRKYWNPKELEKLENIVTVFANHFEEIDRKIDLIWKDYIKG